MKRRMPILLWGGVVAGVAAAAGGFFTRAAAALLSLVPRHYVHYILGGGRVALHARVLGIYMGVALAACCGFALGYRYCRRRPDFAFLRTGRGKLLFALVAILALLVLSLSVNRVFWDDEIEHVHASWYVHSGQVPYSDFFEHHHPLLWFLLAPLLSIFGERLAVLGISRLLMLLLAGGIAWLTWRIGRLAGGSIEVGLLAVALLFSNFMFIPCVMEIRPDVPMVFLALAAVERLLIFHKEGKPLPLLAAAFFAALAFLFLQKAVFLLPPALVLLCAWRLSGRIGPRLFWQTAAAFFLPLVLFAAWLLFSGSLRDYFLCNWLLNAKRQAVYSLWLDIGRMALINAAFWLSLLPALVRSLCVHASSTAMKVVAGFGATLLAALVLLPNPADRHFLLSLPLASIVVGGWAGDRSRFPLRGRWRAMYLAALLAVPLPFLIGLSFPLNGFQLQKFAYVLQRTPPGDRVLDGRNDFNLFRPDLHYFWFQVGPGEMLDNYRHVRGDRRSEYDACLLIRAQKPRFISLDNREWSACGVWGEYSSTPYAGLFFRESTPPVQSP
jgi:hypothetical protein